MSILTERNRSVKPRYIENVNRINQIYQETLQKKEPVFTYFNALAQKAMTIIDLQERDHKTFVDNNDLETLLIDNHKNYDVLMKSNYEQSYANPSYACKELGNTYGAALSAIYYDLATLVKDAIAGRLYIINDTLNLIIKTYDVFYNKSEAAFLDQLMQWKKDAFEVRAFHQSFTGLNFNNDFLTSILDNNEFKSPKDVFRFGEYVTEYEVKMSEFLSDYSDQQLDEMGQRVAEAYIQGFVADGKKHEHRTKASFVAVLGQERITKYIIKHMRLLNKEPFVTTFEKTELNHQAEYDHKFDNALYLDEEAANLVVERYRAAYELQKEAFFDYGGIMYVENFGAEPFSPKENPDRLTLSEEQQGYFQKITMGHRQMHLEFIPETERSFCIIAFPTPEIGEQFEAIFEDIIKINSLDSKFYSQIQQHIIDALDEGVHVRVRGKDGNKTDMKVMMQPINNKEKETNFSNCVADVNIPVGEVYTSPQLTGTEGTLHIDTVFLDGFNYVDLTLTFKDGEIKTYTCKNFENEEDNKKYIEENLMFPHKSLPIGEFAIGTNTLAYTVAEKYNIVDKLPILIVEKMGPHFAVGDTCYMWAEDSPVYNPDGKEITARHNEKSRLKDEDISKAYTNCHTDITIPYDSIGEISVVKEDGSKIEIISNGRFVLKGTEPLNEHFE